MKKNNGVAISPEEKHKGKSKKAKVNKLRYAEYYAQQDIQDELYKRSLNGDSFDRLMSLITSDANIIMAYRSIKRNSGSKTPGTDGLTIRDVEKLEPNEVCEISLKAMFPEMHGEKKSQSPMGKPDLSVSPVYGTGLFSSVFCKYLNQYAKRNSLRSVLASDR